MNVLLTSAGRRGYMVNYFKEALNGNGKVYVGNCNENAVSFIYADESVVTPLIYDNNYIEFLIQYCISNNIRVIIPLFDIDLHVLAANKNLFKRKGIDVIVSDISVIDICNDKWHTKCYLEKNQILTPKTYLLLKDAIGAIERKEVRFPLIIKPRWGMGSIGLYEVENIEELKVLYFKAKRDIVKTYLQFESKQDLDRCILIQEKIEGQEYGVDIINDLSGEYQNTIVKRKYALRAGETDIAVVMKNKLVENMGEYLGNKLGHIANLDVDIIVTEKKEIYIIDLNARFGGGYPFSHCAGVNLPKAIIAWIEGNIVEKEWLFPCRNGKSFKDILVVGMKNSKN